MTYEYRNTKVNLLDDLTETKEISDGVKKTINRRLSSNMSMAKDLTKTEKNLHINFISVNEERNYPKNMPYIEVPLKDCTRKIWLKYGLQPKDVTEEDIDVAKKMWYCPLNVVQMNGKLYIDTIE